MTIEVKHRPDSLLQNSVKEGIPPGTENTYVGKVTQPHHEMALKFLDERIIGKEFENEADLQEVLKTWPQFAKENGLEVDHEWDSIDLYGERIGFEGSIGGPFVIGIIEQLNNL